MQQYQGKKSTMFDTAKHLLLTLFSCTCKVFFYRLNRRSMTYLQYFKVNHQRIKEASMAMCRMLSPNSTKEPVRKHIGSIKGRKSHYNTEEKQRIYLSSELNVTKLYYMFKEKNPDVKSSYESYRTTFNTEFNIAFGYPQTDICSTCDSLIVKKSYIQSELKTSCSDHHQTMKLQREEKKLTEEHESHKRKSDVFYSEKREPRRKAEKNDGFEAVVLNFQKNLYVRNKTTYDVYYKRQLSCFSFNVYILSSKESHFYSYDATVTRKGADDMCSFLL